MRETITALCCLCLIGCGSSPDTDGPIARPGVQSLSTAQSETERLNAWFEDRYEEQLHLYPSWATLFGYKIRYDEMDDLSEEALDRNLAWQRETVNTMEREFDYAALTPDARISYDIWKFDYEDAAANAEFRANQYVFTQGGLQVMLPTFLINFHRVDDPGDMDAYIKRLSGLARAMNQSIDRAQQYARDGIRPPRFAYEIVAQQAKAVITGAPFTEGGDSSLWTDANQKIDSLLDSGTITTDDADAYRVAARVSLLSDFKGAYERLIAWVESDIRHTDEMASGVGQLPNGAAYYRQSLKSYTTTDMTADEIHKLGLVEVSRLRKEMEEVKDAVGFKGDLQEFLEFVRDDSGFYYPNTDEGRQAYIEEVESKLGFINERLPYYFGVLPKADVVVRRVEPYREEDGAAQHYMPPTPDGSRPGIYYIHLSDMTAMPKPQLEVVAYHEGNPGHHMQIAIALELDNVPTFRTQKFVPAYNEGWGLYAELLALEMGAYEDAYSNFGRLSSEMWRALRLVVDTGLHSKGWSEQQAIDFMLENSAEPLATVQSEVRRYLVDPGQATAYKIGMLKILELRSRAEHLLGDRFDIRAFHDKVLAGGPMPLSILDRHLVNWIDEVNEK